MKTALLLASMLVGTSSASFAQIAPSLFPVQIFCDNAKEPLYFQGSFAQTAQGPQGKLQVVDHGRRFTASAQLLVGAWTATRLALYYRSPDHRDARVMAENFPLAGSGPFAASLLRAGSAQTLSLACSAIRAKPALNQVYRAGKSDQPDDNGYGDICSDGCADVYWGRQACLMFCRQGHRRPPT